MFKSKKNQNLFQHILGLRVERSKIFLTVNNVQNAENILRRISALNLMHSREGGPGLPYGFSQKDKEITIEAKQIYDLDGISTQLENLKIITEEHKRVIQKAIPKNEPRSLQSS
ncbi:MAG: hypothetical protein WCW01_02170 [Gammaproteobacteria bacterium]|jgi:hypothetical protein